MNEVKKPTENKPADNKVAEKPKEQSTNAIQVTKTSDIISHVLGRINDLVGKGALRLPPDYSAENALQTAYIMITSPNKDNKILANICTRDSVAIALFGMVVRALNPLKDQVWFMAYGDRLKADPSYFGRVSLAKRVGMKEIYANIIYEEDTFEFKVDTKTGRQELITHESNIENIDVNKIKGAYAIYEMNDGRYNMEVMTIQQIKKSWMKGGAKGESPAHRDTPDQMAKRTVIQRACKMIVNTSDDSYLDKDDEDVDTQDIPATVIDEKANKHLLTFDESQDVTAEKQPDTEIKTEKPPTKETPAPEIKIIEKQDKKDVKQTGKKDLPQLDFDNKEKS